MEKRALIAVAISLAILVLYQEVILKQLYPQPAVTPESAPPAPPVPPESLPAPVDLGAPPAGAVAAPAGRELVIDTELYRAVIDSAGGRLASFRLKRYRAAVAPDSPPQEIVSGGAPYPLGVQLRGKENLDDGGVEYQADRDHLELSGNGEGTLTLTGALGDATVTKTFAFRSGTYLIGLEVKVDGAAAFSELGLTWHRAGELTHAGSAPLFSQVAVLQGKKVLPEPFDGLADGKVIDKDIVWAAYDGPHFLAAMVPRAGESMRVWLKQRDRTTETMVLAPRRDGRLGAHLDVYAGPKTVDTLEQSGHSLARAVDLGYFGFIAIPLLHALRWSNKVTGNYGLDIILLTVVIKVLFIPLTQKSFKSMKAMQKLQPEMARIREKYKDQPEQVNKEVMELYRRHKVNPFGGCLPMVLQLPVFIGLYNALSHAVELRHAPFFLWINDLSAPDRLGALAIPFVAPPGIPVLTLLMGASMFIQQWMTPSAGDPNQRKMMLMMPVIFTAMFVTFPAGLTIYWLVNNVLSIAQQYLINRMEQ